MTTFLNLRTQKLATTLAKYASVISAEDK